MVEFIMVRQKEVRVFQTVDAIKDSIDQISNDSFFTYGWFKTLESFGMLPEPLYLVITQDMKDNSSELHLASWIRLTISSPGVQRYCLFFVEF